MTGGYITGLLRWDARLLYRIYTLKMKGVTPPNLTLVIDTFCKAALGIGAE